MQMAGPHEYKNGPTSDARPQLARSAIRLAQYLESRSKMTEIVQGFDPCATADNASTVTAPHGWRPSCGGLFQVLDGIPGTMEPGYF